MIKITFTFIVIFCELITIETVDLSQFNGDDCYRDCTNSAPRICYYKWLLEHFHTMGPACGQCGKVNGSISDCFLPQCITADGLQRGVMSINRQIPGPPIHVCQNDQIVVDITNGMGGSAATIHWHGLHQRETPYMDGVPFVTQCPIDFATTFRYSFKATEPGTQFYHSHTGHHKVNGHYGGLVIRRPKSDDPNSNLYDYDLKEHLIVASDWMNNLGEFFTPGLPANKENLRPTNFLVNGRGNVIDRNQCRPKTATPLAFFRVRSGQRYRFRFVNAMSHNCPVILEIEGHSMQIIASDSYDLQPVTIDSLVSTSGERYDFVLNANQKIGSSFWIRLVGVGMCEGFKIEQFAVLAYAPSSVSDLILSFPQRRFPKFAEPFVQNERRFLNHPNATCSDSSIDKKSLCITDLSSYDTEPSITDVIPDHRFILGFDLNIGPISERIPLNNFEPFMSISEDIVAIGTVNNITFTFPSFSLLTQPDDVDESLFCDENNRPERCDDMRICSCVHRIKVELGSIVELVIVDEAEAVSQLNHPFHLHGYRLYVTGMGQHPDGIPMTVNLAKQMIKQRTLRKSLNNMHPIKDTISIPSRGYTIFRFKADNPGWWILHCHFEWHVNVGMGFLLQVGETSEMVKAPENFPKCNSYTPDVEL
ncbi:hypothetical protein PVAND_006846 [Polypedilum vanderplanki]|uniref:Uncharacterized protein n=1 Tax=Polypedilum vanderplanki TaxID=319348 RepID=A0A9J6C635_POLVA|nr:hypothetical protein PVAND_006846 [Polypedilum vanderplanki]